MLISLRSSMPSTNSLPGEEGELKTEHDLIIYIFVSVTHIPCFIYIVHC